MFSRSWLPAAALAAVLVAACSAPAPPTADQLKNQFNIDLPAHLRASSFVLDAEQVPASRTEAYRAKFRADVQLVSPVYVEEQRFGDTVIVRMAGKAGDRRTVFGRVEARLKNRHWASTLRLENNPADQPGRPRDLIQARRIIVAGTPEEAQFWSARRAVMEREQESAAQAERARFFEQLTGEWQGEVFRRKDSRLYVVGSGEALTATLLHGGYREEMAVQVLDDRRILFTGFAVVRQDGREARNYSLDTFDLEMSYDGQLLHGSAWDASAQSGPVRLVKIGS